MIKLNKFAGAVAMLVASASSLALPVFKSGKNEINFVAYENQYRLTSSCDSTFKCLDGTTGEIPADGTLGTYSRVDTSVPGNIKVDDFFLGVFQVSFVNSKALTTTPNTGGEFTGYFVHHVGNIVPGDGSNVNVLLTSGTDPFGKLASNELFAFYTDANVNFEQANGITIAGSVANATDGLKWAGLSLDGVGNTYAYTSTDLSVAANQKSGSFFSALNYVNQGPTYNLTDDLNPVNDPDESFYGGAAASSRKCSAAEIAANTLSCTDVFGNADVKLNSSFTDTDSLSPWFFQVNDPVVFDMNLPEPASLALAGIALMAIGAVRRKKRAA